MVAGIAFTFSPYHFGRGTGTLQLVAMEWVPAHILFVLRTLDRGLVFRPLVPAAATMAMLLESSPLPFPTTSIDVPDFYREIAADREPYALITVPVDARHMYFATVHGKPIAGGIVARTPRRVSERLRLTPILDVLMLDTQLDRLPRDPDLPRRARELFARLGVRYVVSHRYGKRQYLEECLQLRPVRKRGGMRVYDCRSKP